MFLFFLSNASTCSNTCTTSIVIYSKFNYWVISWLLQVLPFVYAVSFLCCIFTLQEGFYSHKSCSSLLTNEVVVQLMMTECKFMAFLAVISVIILLVKSDMAVLALRGLPFVSDCDVLQKVIKNGMVDTWITQFHILNAFHHKRRIFVIVVSWRVACMDLLCSKSATQLCFSFWWSAI